MELNELLTYVAAIALGCLSLGMHFYLKKKKQKDLDTIWQRTEHGRNTEV